MKTRILIVALWFIAAEHAFASPQVRDRIFIGGTSYRIHQTPMSGYWYQDGLPGDGHVRFPKFEITSPNNWRGYVAEWSISDKKLYLRSVEAQVDGEKVRNRQIIDKRFPIHASWFTGEIFVAVGYFDYEANTSNYVIEFDIEGGNVRSTSFHQSLQIPYTWNGLPSDSSEEGGTEQPPVTERAADGGPPQPAR